MKTLKCDICHKEASVLMKFGEENLCSECYNGIFGKDADKVKISQYIKSIKEDKEDIKEMLESYHQICLKYEEYMDESKRHYIEDMNKIKEVIHIYSKGIGLNVYNDHIKPILTHINYFINKELNN